MVALVDFNTVAGLSEQDAASRLKQEGYNELPSTQSQSLWLIAWDMVQDPIFLLLVGGGHHLLDFRRLAGSFDFTRFCLFPDGN